MDGLRGESRRIKRHLGQVEYRYTHVDQALLTRKAHKAARAVTAMLHFTAIGIVNHVRKINRRRWGGPYRQNLVRTHTEVTVSQKPVLRWRQTQQAARFIKHHKVVARTLHFCEFHFHERSITLRYGFKHFLKTSHAHP